MISKIKQRIIWSVNFILKILIKINIKSIDESIDYLVDNNKSVSRFGDGEMILINGGGIRFQEANEELSVRLKEIISSNKDIMICIPGSLISTNNLTSVSKKYWDQNLKESRYCWYKYMNIKKVYYDAKITRLYIDFKDKSYSEVWFKKIKKVWDKRDVVIIEGEKSRLGMGNNLFNNVKSIKRILAPQFNAYNKYHHILEYVKENIKKDKLILIALGPTATVLAYDLNNLGYQAIDIGHIDIEYEWYLRKVEEKVKINNKFVNEVLEGNLVGDSVTNSYKEEIIHKIV